MEALIVWELKHQDLVETRQGQVKEIENPDLVFFLLCIIVNAI